MVGTFHAAAKRQKAIFAIGPILEPVIEKLSARIAVSEAARETLTEHLETDAVVIPNGIYADRYRDGKAQEKWQGNTLGFIGRFEEPRKGLSVLVDALPIISRFAPDVRVFIAGPGEADEVIKSIDPQLRSRFTFLGKISEEDKANFLASISLYIAPNTGGESFGIILAEALAGGATVVASDIPAFDSLLNHGQYGELFESESSTDLAKRVIDLLRDENRRVELGKTGKSHAQQFDWKVVADQIFSIYEMSLVSGEKVRLASDSRSWSRFLGREPKGDE
jgi:phosphatidylinositol alpha-mannosyltransferase